MAGAEDSAERRRAAVNKYNAARRERMAANPPVVPAEKQCVACGEIKPAAAFSRHSGASDGLQPRCKVCVAREHAAKQDEKGRKRRMSASLMERLGVEQEVPPVEDTPDGPIMRVPLAGGQFAVIDAADWPLVAGCHWHVSGGYAVTNGGRAGARRSIYMHVVIYGALVGLDVDHDDLDRLNNRRGNLRPATRSQNHGNKAQRRDAFSSRFKGVRRLPSGRWEARIGQGTRSIGVFDAEDDAARAYDVEARAAFGAFARLNFPM